MRHPFERINRRTRKIIRRIHFPRIPRAMMQLRTAPVDDGIAHRLIRVVHRDLRPHKPPPPLLAPRLHLLEPRRRLLRRRLPPRRRNPVHPLRPHRLLRRIVRVRLPIPARLHTEIVQLLEVVRRVRRLVRLDPHER